jgi:hypothetical protein
VASLDSQSVALNYTDKYSYEWNVITNRDYSLSKDQWHWVSIETKGTEIKISVDDVVLINTDDTRYKNGTIEIGVGQYTHAQYDDIQVTSLNK